MVIVVVIFGLWYRSSMQAWNMLHGNLKEMENAELLGKCKAAQELVKENGNLESARSMLQEIQKTAVSPEEQLVELVAAAEEDKKE